MSLAVAKQIAEETGKSVEVVDIRSLIPLDKEGILKSVRKTNRVLVVHEDKVFGGFGGEIAAMITEEAFTSLDAPVKRVGSTFTPVGFNRILEKAILPDQTRIYNAAMEVLNF
jgi:2-oxoisovalerate dehydrogenase E1 component